MLLVLAPSAFGFHLWLLFLVLLLLLLFILILSVLALGVLGFFLGASYFCFWCSWLWLLVFHSWFLLLVFLVVASLVLGLKPRQGLARLRAKREAWGSHLMLPIVQKV